MFLSNLISNLRSSLSHLSEIVGDAYDGGGGCLKDKTTLINSSKSVFSGGDIINAFWKWNDLTSYIIALVVFAILAGIITYMFTPV